MLQRYLCDRARTGDGRLACLSFGGSAVDAMVAAEILRVVQPAALAAAAHATRAAAAEYDQFLKAMRLELEAMRCAATRARRGSRNPRKLFSRSCAGRRR